MKELIDKRYCAYISGAFALGAVSLTGQAVFLREFLTVFQGNEISVGLVLGAWLCWTGIGATIGGVFFGRLKKHSFWLMLNSTGLLAALPLTVFGIRAVRGFFNIMPGVHFSFVDMAFACLLLMAPVCVMLGAHFVLVSGIWRKGTRQTDTTSAGNTYICEASGNMLGGLFFTFFMVRRLDAFRSAALVGVFVFISSLLIIRQPGSAGVRRRPFACILPWLIPALVVFFLPALKSFDEWAYRVYWSHFAPRHELVTTRQSRHGVISVLRFEGQYSFFQSGHLLFTVAGRSTESPGLEDQESAHFAHLAMVQHRAPEEILLIGGGAGGVLSGITRHPAKRIDYVELDEALTGVVGEYVSGTALDALADPRVRLIHEDGRLFVKTSNTRYDMVVVDAPDPATSVMNRFYTREFFHEVSGILRDDGVFVITAASTPDLRGTAIANRNATIYHTLKSVFDYVSTAGDMTMFYFASNDPDQVSVDYRKLQERYDERGVVADGFSRHHYQLLLRESRLRRLAWTLQHHGRSETAHLDGPGQVPLNLALIDTDETLEPVRSRHFINSDFRPIGYFYTLMFWNEISGRVRPEAFKMLLRVRPAWVLPFVFLPFCAVLLLKATARVTGKKCDTFFATGFAVFTTGLSTMAMQVALLFAFQSIYGFVYETVGLIIAVFMGGLATGAFCTQKFVKNKADIKVFARLQLAIAVFSVGLAFALPGAAVLQSSGAVLVLFFCLTFIAGFINGVDFPLATACYMGLRKNPEKSVGAVYAFELFGACAGATIASLIIAPVMGIAACCIFAGIANCAAFVVLRM